MLPHYLPSYLFQLLAEFLMSDTRSFGFTAWRSGNFGLGLWPQLCSSYIWSTSSLPSSASPLLSMKELRPGIDATPSSLLLSAFHYPSILLVILMLLFLGSTCSFFYIYLPPTYHLEFALCGLSFRPVVP